MRKTFALAILLYCLQGASRGTEIADRYPLETEFRKLCTGIPVLVSILDDQGQPMKSAQVVAVSDDWGVRLPVTGGPFAYTDEKGTVTLTLFQGRWLILAGYRGTPGEGGLLGKRIVLGSDPLTVGLRPDSCVDVVLPADAQQVFAMEAGCVPFAAMPYCGVSSAGRFRLHSMNDLQYRLLFVRYPDDSPGFLLLSSPVKAGESLQMSLQDEELGRMVFDIEDSNDPGGIMHFNVGYPTADIERGSHITYFQVRPTQELFVSPGVVNYYLTYDASDGSAYWFIGKSVTLGPGERVDVRGGGPLQTKVLASSGVESANAINLLLNARDSFGNTLNCYRAGPSRVAPVVNVSLSDEASTPVLSGNAGDWLRLRVELSDLHGAQPEALRYEVDWDLGVFGRSTLSGPLFTPETAYGFEHVPSDHFDGYFPFGFTQQAAQVLERLEATYSFMAEYASHTPSYRLHVYLPSDPGGSGWAGGDSIWLWMGGLLHWNPDDPVNIWEPCLFHELGHHMLSSINDSRNEALASVLAFEACDSIGDVNKARWNRIRECQGFLQNVEGTFPDTSPDYEYAMNRFLLHIYLPKVFGHSIHSSFFKDWIESRAALVDFSEADAFVTLYSFHSQMNLADAFQAIGYTTTPETVYAGLTRLEKVLAPRPQ